MVNKNKIDYSPACREKATQSEKRFTRPLYETDNKKIFFSDFVDSLRKVGISDGDVVFVYSDITAFGKMSVSEISKAAGRFSASDRDFLFETLVETIKEVVGENGTIIMPAFSYSFCNKKLFDVADTKSTVGVLTEYFRKQPEVVRTVHPIFSAAIWGKQKEYLSDIGKDSFGEDSIFGKLHKIKGKNLIFGSSFGNSFTFLHYIEQSYGIPYRYMKTFEGKIRWGDREYEDEYTFYVRHLDKNTDYDLWGFERHLLEKGLMKKAALGRGEILSIEADILFREAYRQLDKNIFYFLKEKPNIED